MHINPASVYYITGVNYQIGDEIVAKDDPMRVIGVCTGFTNDNTCVLINGKNWGGKLFFMKSEWQKFEIIEDDNEQ